MSHESGLLLKRCLLPAVVVFAGKNSVQRQRMVYKVSQQRCQAEQGVVQPAHCTQECSSTPAPLSMAFILSHIPCWSREEGRGGNWHCTAQLAVLGVLHILRVLLLSAGCCCHMRCPKLVLCLPAQPLEQSLCCCHCLAAGHLDGAAGDCACS
jgi:hypothetical protein